MVSLRETLVNCFPVVRTLMAILVGTSCSYSQCLKCSGIVNHFFIFHTSVFVHLYFIVYNYSGKGTCMSLRRIADYSYNEYQELAGISYETPWDAEYVVTCYLSTAGFVPVTTFIYSVLFYFHDG